MKRHDSLAILSREHHGALILAQLLKNGAPIYKGLPRDPVGKAEYARGFYQDELVKHFEEEEQIVITRIRGINSSLDKMADEIIAEHTILRELFTTTLVNNELAIHLDRIGITLDQHIRKEERMFFPLIQECCSEKILEEIGKALAG